MELSRLTEDAMTITQRQRAEAVVNTVKAELPPIWLGGRQRMILVDEIAKALTTTRQEALREAKGIITQAATWTPQSVVAILDCLAREGVRG